MEKYWFDWEYRAWRLIKVLKLITVPTLSGFTILYTIKVGDMTINRVPAREIFKTKTALFKALKNNHFQL